MSTLSGGPNIVTDGLVLYLDAANPASYVSGSTAWNDISRGGNNGTLVNGPTFNSESGGSIVFDGVNDYVTTPDNNSLDISDNITIEYWFNTSQYRSDVYSVNFIRKFINTTTANFQFYFDGTYNPQRIRVLANRGGVWGIVSPNSSIIPLNTWTHVVWTYSNGGLLYINSVSQGVAVGSGTLATNTEPIILGNEINGKIAQYKMYNRALTPLEILQNYNSTKGRFGL